MGLLTDEIKKSQFLHKIFFKFAIALASTIAGCGGVAGNLTSSPTPPAVQSLTAADVTSLVQTAAQAADSNTMVIAVVDRSGNVLGVYRKPSAPTLATGNFSAQVDVNELAVSLARTAAFFSNDQAPLSSRTVRFLSGIHFPPELRTRRMRRSTESKTRIADAFFPQISFPGKPCRPRARSVA